MPCLFRTWMVRLEFLCLALDIDRRNGPQIADRSEIRLNSQVRS